MIIKEVKNIVSKYNTRNPLVIASEMGIDVLCLAFNKLYGLACSLGSYRLIGVNSRLDDHIKRLVVAHELGHFILHPRGSFFFVLSETSFYSKWEYQANLFAIGLCVGEKIARSEMIKELAAGNVNNLCEIAKYI